MKEYKISLVYYDNVGGTYVPLTIPSKSTLSLRLRADYIEPI